MEAENDFAYAAEYAKSSRAQCKGCKNLIAKDSLRLALMVKSSFYDGKQAMWYHYSCFFGKCRPTTTDEIEHFNNLRFPDQEKIQAQIDGIGKGKAGKKGAGLKVTTLKDFVVQYAKSNRSECRGCGEKIEKNEIRFSHKEIHPEKPQLGLVDRWHHVGCFLKKREEFGWKDHFTAEMVVGFNSLDAEDKVQIKELLKAKAKKGKAKKDKDVSSVPSTTVQDSEDKLLKKKIKTQMMLMWKNIDRLKALDLKKGILSEMLEANNQQSPTGIDNIYLAVGDGMTFGALPLCPECKNGNLVVGTDSYHCRGQVSEWTSCSYTTIEVERKPWVVPGHLKELDTFLAKYKYKKLDRTFPPRAAPLQLKHKKIFVSGKVPITGVEIKQTVEKLGGTITTSVSKAYFCISTKENVARGGKKISDLQVQDVFVVSAEILTALQELPKVQPLLPLLKKFSVAEWGSEQRDRGGGKRALQEENSNTEMKKMKMILKSGVAVDPGSGLENETHILVKSGLKYAATLAMVDMSSGLNSYYKLQLLESDSWGRFYVYRSWGRVGTNIGGDKLEKFSSAEEAITQFKGLYSDKTGNEFGAKFFRKQPRKFYPLEIDYGEEEKKFQDLQSAGNKSKLHKEVQKIIKMIFDIDSMKKAMVEFELDLNKLPLGKLSKRQMERAYAVLTEANNLIEAGELMGPKIVDCSNRFYTLIPHDFGMRQPPLLNNVDLIKSKVEMIDNLLDIEVACKLLQGEVGTGDAKDAEEIDPLDVHYKKLQCGIKPLDKTSEMYEAIVEMVKNTHTKTHSWYRLGVEEIFELDRKGEQSTYRPFKSLHNRQLLWHGSRVTNYAGILSQGLKIAPPEAPVTGYMFGKGIYFADMVSKSANYCSASNANPTGLLLLAEVALGNMYELPDAKDVRKLPKGKHSVKGVGTTMPDGAADFETKDGATAHAGSGVESDVKRSSLLYNEYIVYDVAQVNLKYLVKTKFEFESRW